MFLLGQVQVCSARVRLIRVDRHLEQVTAHVACLRQVHWRMLIIPPLVEDEVHDVRVVVDIVEELLGQVDPGPPSCQRLPLIGIQYGTLKRISVERLSSRSWLAVAVPTQQR